MDTKSSSQMVTLAGGCFWCIEAIFDQLKGIEKVESGFSGGKTINPTYEEGCSGTTGHAEAVDITFDPKAIPLADIFDVFFTLHDPTTLNRQGADEGTQYRSAIFYRSPEQKTAAEAAMVRAKKIWDNPIVTEVALFKAFYSAEAHHQKYYENNSNQSYCRIVIAPKVAKLRKLFFEKLKKP